MKRVLVVIALLALGCKPPLQPEWPAAVGSETSSAGEVRRLSVRVYASQNFRRETLRWRKHVASVLERVNLVAGPGLSVRFEIVESLDWERTANHNDTKALVRELRALDSAADVDWVVGFVTQLPDLTPRVDDLGAGLYLGKHMVLRGTNDVVAYKRLHANYDDIDKAELDHVFEARRIHKQLVVFLHELGHNLGALHTGNAGVMGPSYNREVMWFTPANEVIVKSGLRFRGTEGRGTEGTDARDRIAEQVALLTLLEDSVDHGWDPSEQARTITLLRQNESISGSQPRVPTSAEPSFILPSGTPQEVLAILRKRQQEAGNQDVALAHAICRFSYLSKSTDFMTCALAAGLATQSFSQAWRLALEYRRAGMVQRELVSLKNAGKHLDETSPTQSRLALATRLSSLGHLAWAEEFLEPVLGAAEVTSLAETITRRRRRFGIPRSTPPADEAEIGKLIDEAIWASRERNPKQGVLLAKEGVKRFPEAAGFHMVLCQIALRLTQFGRARKECLRAVALDPEGSWAHYLLGAAEFNMARLPMAVAPLEKALSVDPGITDAWRMLFRVHRTTKNPEATEDLRKRYVAQFGKSPRFQVDSARSTSRREG